MTIKHAKVITHTPQDDGTVEIQTDSYHEEPSSFKQEIMQHKTTSRHDFFSDLIDSVALITKKITRELTLRITVDEAGDPTLITETYTTKKEHYPKR
jgi:hypothetical protein